MALDVDDLEPVKPTQKPLDLEELSIEDLREYIASMEAEIARVKAVIDSKQDYRSEAETFFKR